MVAKVMHRTFQNAVFNRKKNGININTKQWEMDKQIKHLSQDETCS